VTSTSASILNSYVYRAFGTLQSSTQTATSDYTFVGQQGYYSDPDILPYFVRARHYNPQLGSWISQDPLGIRGPDTNLFRYSLNQPARLTDPGGLQVMPFPGAFGGSGISVAAQTGTNKIVDVPLPTAAPGCSGWCFSVENSTVKNMTIQKFSFKEVGAGCPGLMTTFATKAKIAAQVKESLNEGMTLDSCSTGCSCQDKKMYNGQTIKIAFAGQAIELDPSEFGFPLNRFKKGDCFLQIWGTATVEIGKGWIGKCCKKQ